MLHCFKGEDFINVENGYRYWSNACGDLFRPKKVHNMDEPCIEVSELPKELQYAFEHGWAKGMGANCYLIEFQGKYGVALETEYDNDWLDSTDLVNTHEELNEFARKKAEEFAKKYPQYEVIFGEDSLVWRSTSGYEHETDTIISIILPWYCSFNEMERVADDMYENAYCETKRGEA